MSIVDSHTCALPMRLRLLIIFLAFVTCASISSEDAPEDAIRIHRLLESLSAKTSNSDMGVEKNPPPTTLSKETPSNAMQGQQLVASDANQHIYADGKMQRIQYNAGPRPDAVETPGKEHEVGMTTAIGPTKPTLMDKSGFTLLPSSILDGAYTDKGYDSIGRPVQVGDQFVHGGGVQDMLNEAGQPFYPFEPISQDVHQQSKDWSKLLSKGTWTLDSMVPVTLTPEEKQRGELEIIGMRAHTGKVEAQLQLAQWYQEGRRVAQSDAEAALWYRRAAMQGNSQAQVGIGVMHSQGRGVMLNHTIALEWFRSAASQNEVLGEYHLGKAYFSGHGVGQSFSSAATWYRKAAKQDHAEAQYQLGQMHSAGQGVYRSDAQSKRWYKAAAAQGHQDAKVALDAILKRERRKDNSTLVSDLAYQVPLILFVLLLLPLVVVFVLPVPSYLKAIYTWYRRIFDWLLSMLSVLLGSFQASAMLLCTQTSSIMSFSRRVFGMYPSKKLVVKADDPAKCTRKPKQRRKVFRLQNDITDPNRELIEKAKREAELQELQKKLWALEEEAGKVREHVSVLGHGLGQAVADGMAPADEDMHCVICLEKERTHVLVPCGHLCLCADCAPNIAPGTCPLCREACAMAVKVYGMTPSNSATPTPHATPQATPTLHGLQCRQKATP